MFFTIILLILIGIVSVATIYILDEPGYVFLQWGVWQIEISLVFAVILTVFALLLLYLALEVLSGVIRIPGRIGRSYREYREHKKYAASVKGIQLLLLGDWHKAEKLLGDAAKFVPEPVISYLAAAYSAQKQGNIDQRNAYLRKAKSVGNESVPVVLIVTCILQIEQEEMTEAIEGLRKLCSLLPKNAMAFRILAKAYVKVEDWQSLEDLVPHLQKTEAYTSAELQTIIRNITLRKLNVAESAVNLQKAWKKASTPIQNNREILFAYIQKLLGFSCYQEAEKVIRVSLERHWDSELVLFYGEVEGEVNSRQMYDMALKWIEANSADSNLLLVAGKLARRSNFDKEAENHLQAAVANGARIEAYAELGQLYEQQKLSDQAYDTFKKAVAGTA